MVRVGCSGWMYQHWRGVLYPPKLGTARWLPRYAELFDTVELNSTFYRLPVPSGVQGWRDKTPPGFLFAAKGSRYLTHLKRLTEVDEGVHRYFDLVLGLGDKLGPVLWQLPPQMSRPDPERLEYFLAHLPAHLRHVVEFRHAGWYTEQVCDVLDAYGAAFCEHDLVQARPPRLTGGFRYLRFHGAGSKYGGRYGVRALQPVARDLARFDGDAFVYFNNDLRGDAVWDALSLQELLGLRLPAAEALEPPPPAPA